MQWGLTLVRWRWPRGFALCWTQTFFLLRSQVQPLLPLTSHPLLPARQQSIKSKCVFVYSCCKPSIPQRQKRPAVEFRMPTPCDASHRYSARGVVQASSLELPTKPRPKQPNQNSLFIIKIIYGVCVCVCACCRSMGWWMTPLPLSRRWSTLSSTVPQTTQYPSPSTLCPASISTSAVFKMHLGSSIRFINWLNWCADSSRQHGKCQV